MIDMDAANAIESAIDAKIAKAASKETRTTGKVTRIDSDGTVFVMLQGSDIETPVKYAAAAVEPDEEVTVTISNGSMSIDGNYSRPATDDRTAKAAQQTADAAVQNAAIAADAAATAVANAEIAEEAAISAQNSLKSVVQGAVTVEKAVSVMQTALEAVVDYDPTTDTTQEYFWHDADGAHVLGDTSGYRNDIDSTGMDIVEVSTEDSVAHFGADGTRIGKEDGTCIEIKPSNVSMFLDSLKSMRLRLFKGTISGSGEYYSYPRITPSNAEYGIQITPTNPQNSPLNQGAKVEIDGELRISGHESYGQTLVQLLKIGAFDAGSNTERRIFDVSGYSFLPDNTTRVASVIIGDASFGLNDALIIGHGSNMKVFKVSWDGSVEAGNYPKIDTNNDYALEIGNGTDDSNRSNALAVDWDGNVYPSGMVGFKSASINRDGSAPSADQWNTRLIWNDKDGERLCLVSNIYRSTGYNEIALYVYNETSAGAEVVNQLNLGVNKNGARTVSLFADPWLTALGLANASTSTSGDATPGTNISIVSCQIATYGKVAHLMASFKCNAAIAAGTTVMTIASGKRPIYESFPLCATPSTGFRFTTGGAIITRTSLANGSTQYIQATYILA